MRVRISNNLIDHKKLATEMTALPKGPWKYCGDDRGGCKCGQIWSADEMHIATAHHVSQAFANDLEAQEVYPDSEETMKAVARAIASIPEMLDALERMCSRFEKAMRHMGNAEWAITEATKAERELIAKIQKDMPKGPAGDRGQVGWMGGEQER